MRRPSLFSLPLSGASLAAVTALLLMPVLMVLASWLQWDMDSAVVLGEMAHTVLPDYAATSVLLCLMVGIGVVVLGSGTALAVSLFDFPGRKTLEWALLLPLAMPAYVVAYAYTDFLQYSGPLQIWLRQATGLQGALWADIRSLWGAALVLSMSLYPYVYLLARTALTERATPLMEAARLLGAPLWRRIWRLALPLARPAIAAGTALALMETLADFGVASYFGVQTFTAGIYKAWLVMDNRVAASQLATSLLLLVALMLKLEHSAQSRLRFANSSGGTHGSEAQALRLHGAHAALAWALCSMPVLLGFGVPVLLLLTALAQAGDTGLPWMRFIDWTWNSLRLGAMTAVLAVGLALAMAYQARLRSHRLSRWAVQWAGLGYAVPGVVIVVGLLLPLGWLQQAWPSSQAGTWLTATVLGLVWAYLVRFVAVALQSVQSGYSRIPVSLDESARMLGTSARTLVQKVHMPLLQRSLVAAFLLVLVDVMKELPATLMLRPFDTDTLAVMAYQLARDERLAEAALPSLALVLVGLVPVMLLSRSLRQRPPAP